MEIKSVRVKPIETVLQQPMTNTAIELVVTDKKVGKNVLFKMWTQN